MRTARPKRLLWLIALWGGSVLTLAAISLLFRLLMTAAGLKSLSGMQRGPKRDFSILSSLLPDEIRRYI